MSESTSPRSACVMIPDAPNSLRTIEPDPLIQVESLPDPSLRDRMRGNDHSLDETVTHPVLDHRLVSGSGDDDCRDTDELIGKSLAHYQIESRLGRGSMARVYRARHLGLERVCALKIMEPGLVSRQPTVRKQFWAEARAAANLIHPHVVTIHNLGTDRGYHFIEMEYVPGGVSLKESLVHGGPFEPLRAAKLVRQVVQALHEAHRAGLVHRDIKPSNVLLTPQGHAKLADFGLVRRLVDLSLGGEPLAGTPTFMAPELFKGTPASPQSDIYALGVMFYYLLSGQLPFRSDRISKLIKLHQSQPVPDIKRLVPTAHDSVVMTLERCMAKSPADRFQSTEELAEAIQVAIQRLRDTETLVRESLEGLDCFIQGSRDTFRIMLPLPGDRLQEVLIEVNDGKNDEQFLSVFSVCGPADPAHYAYALTLNARLTYGSLSIRNVLGTPMFVMSRTFSRDRVRAHDLRDAILEIARRSDRVEQQLTRMDQY